MLKLNVGFNRKVGEPNYGSRGASVHLELELDSGLLGDVDRLKDRIDQLFTMAESSVNEELASPSRDAAEISADAPRRPGKLNGQPRRATASQARAIIAIAERHGIELEELLGARFGVTQPEELSIGEASGLIDELNSAVNSCAHGERS